MGIIESNHSTQASYRTRTGGRAGADGPHFRLRAGGRDELLDSAYEQLRDSQDAARLQQTLDELILLLRDARLQSSPDEWEQWIGACRGHSLLQLLHEDPFTRRAFEKPRGYAGDAVLLDYIYGVEERWATPEMTLRGRRIFDYTTRSPAPQGVRSRRAFVARMIDRLTERRDRPHVLSIASGHLREALLSAAVRRRRLGRLVALDADPRSTAVAAADYGCLDVEACTASFRQLFTGRLDLGRFDLVYSTGLFDYLQHSSSRRLLSVMFDLLAPGGKLLVANFLPGVRDVGYMEAFMDWRLVYRTRHELMEMTADLSQTEIEEIRIFAEEHQNILFLQVGKSRR